MFKKFEVKLLYLPPINKTIFKYLTIRMSSIEIIVLVFLFSKSDQLRTRTRFLLREPDCSWCSERKLWIRPKLQVRSFGLRRRRRSGHKPRVRWTCLPWRSQPKEIIIFQIIKLSLITKPKCSLSPLFCYKYLVFGFP